MGSKSVLQTRFEAAHKIHSFVQNGNNDGTVARDPSNIVVFASMDVQVRRQLLERLGERPPCSNCFTTPFDPVEICVGLSRAPCLVRVVPDTSEILFRGVREIVVCHPGLLPGLRPRLALDVINGLVRELTPARLLNPRLKKICQRFEGFAFGHSLQGWRIVKGTRQDIVLDALTFERCNGFELLMLFLGDVD